MKLDLNRSHRGKCYVCGKSTKLLIHAACGKSLDKKESETKIGLGELTQTHNEKGNRPA